MTKFFTPYSLNKNKVGGIHQASTGVLFKIIHDEGVGYSLYHPIDSLGDRSIDSILNLMKDDAICSRDKTCQKIIASSGSLLSHFEERSTLGNTNIDCYYSGGLQTEISELIINKEVLSKNFSTVKLKIQEIKELDVDLFESNSLRLILDFNQKGNSESLESFLRTEKNRNVIDYVEDPPRNFRNEFNLKIAADFDKSLRNPDIIIVKPTGFEHDPIKGISSIKHITTSYLDHPLGQLISALSVKDEYLNHHHGLMTHKFYKSNKYSELLSTDSKFKIDRDLINSFHTLLENEKWERL